MNSRIALAILPTILLSPAVSLAVNPHRLATIHQACNHHAGYATRVYHNPAVVLATPNYGHQVVQVVPYAGAGLSVQGDARAQKRFNDLQGMLVAMNQQLAKLQKEIADSQQTVSIQGTFQGQGTIGGNVTPPQPPTPQPPNPQPVPPQPTPGPGPDPIDNPAPPLTQAVADLFNKSCISCHGQQKQDGGLNLTQPFSEVIAARIMKRTFLEGEGQMPPGGGLSDADRAAIFDWASSDVPTQTKALRSKR